jgi:cytochrome c biogenesis protein CcmG/thiol:disulfide interchange protein DsbE
MEAATVAENTIGIEQPLRTKRRWGKWLALAVLGGMLVFLAAGLVNAYTGPLSEGTAPDFTLTTFEGETITLSQFRGQVVVINFWASWCIPCREEAAYLETTWRKYRDQGVVFIGVNYVDAEREALAYLDEFDITYYNGPDIGIRISDLYYIQGIRRHLRQPQRQSAG